MYIHSISIITEIYSVNMHLLALTVESKKIFLMCSYLDSMSPNWQTVHAWVGEVVWWPSTFTNEVLLSGFFWQLI